MEATAGGRASVEGVSGVGRWSARPRATGRECAAAALPEVGRGAAHGGPQGAAESGFRARVTQGAGRILPTAAVAAAPAQRRLCSRQERRAARAQSPSPSLELGGPVPSEARGTAGWRKGRTRCPAPRLPPAPPGRLTFSLSATSRRRDTQCWRLLWLLSISVLLPAVTRTRSATGKQPGPRVAPATSAPGGSWFWLRARLRCAPHSWT